MLCPRCGSDNIAGIDRCENCLEPFRDRDVPQATQGMQRLLMEEPVSSIEHIEAVVVDGSCTVAKAARLMKGDQNGCVLVESGGSIVGIFTERDLLLKIAGQIGDLDTLAIEDVMTRAPETVAATDSLRFALNKMSVGGFRHIPIIPPGRAAGPAPGVVTGLEVLKFLAHRVFDVSQGH